MNIKNSKGFTLVELLVTLAVIGILTSVILAGLNGVRAKGRDARRIADIKQIQGAIENYFSSCYEFPESLDDLGSSTACVNYTPVLSSMPYDPLTGVPYNYYVTPEGEPKRFHLCAVLEYSYGNNKGKAGKVSFDGGIEDLCDGDTEGTNPNADKVFDVVGGVL